MLKHFKFLGLLLLLFPFAINNMAQELSTLNFDGHDRSYILRLPENYDETGAYPVLIALHGAGGDAVNLQTGTHIDELADEFGYISVFPDGFQRGWNFLDESEMAQGENYTDDVGFLAALIEEIATNYAVDRGRIFMVGYSNGGLMAIRMACELDDVLSGAAFISATYSFELAQHCQGTNVIPSVLIWGSADEIFPAQGFVLIGRDGTMRSSFSFNQTRSYLNSRYQCAGQTAVTVSAETSRFPVDRELLVRCASGVPAAVYTIIGGGHNYPDSLVFRTLDGTETTHIEMAFFDFFNNIRRPDVEMPNAESTESAGE